MTERQAQTMASLQKDVQALTRRCQILYRQNIIYEKLLNSSTDGFLVVGCDGTIIDINMAYCNYLGLDRDKVIGQPVLSVIPNSKMQTVISDGLTELDVMHALPDGMTPSGEKTVCVSRMPVVDNGETIAAVATIKFSHHTISLAKTLQRLEEEVSYYRTRLSRYAIGSFDDLPSESPTYGAAKRMAQRFANSDLPILLLGETGVGKEVFANAIHQASDRANQPFVCVNCASIPGELLESELFGYVDGAFTGSRRTGKKGKFEIANGGTLFLDEIGEMPPQMQSKLLRVLQNQEVEKLGAEKPIQVNVRIIAATNRDLLRCVEAKTFRSDLYYRLNVLTITIPALRERMEDIPFLAGAVLKELVEKYGRNVALSPQAMALLQGYAWPGNVRELRNAIGRGFMLTDGREILPEHLPAAIVERRDRPDDGRTIEGVTQRAQQQLILNCLVKHGGNFSRAASELGVHRTTLYARVRAMGVDIRQLRSNFDGFATGVQRTQM